METRVYRGVYIDVVRNEEARIWKGYVRLLTSYCDSMTQSMHIKVQWFWRQGRALGNTT